VDAAIAGLELVAASHWRGTQEARLGDWLLRAADGFTGRANSALAVGDPGVPLQDALAAVTGWYRARGLPPMIAVPMPLGGEGSPPGRRDQDLDHFLAQRNWATRPGPAFVMITGAGAAPGPLSLPPGTTLRMDAEPDDAWLAMYHYRGRELPAIARTLLMSAPWQGFASIRDAAGRPLAIARLSVGGGWAGITAVEVPAARRRQGLGTMITRAVCEEAARPSPKRLRSGQDIAQQVFLQVETDNTAAQAMYGRCGFRYSHRYHYRVAPCLPG
jgi:ribosomal protein S18 acetylase RimI-like enzyme